MSAPLKVVFMGTPEFAIPTLQRLAEDPLFEVMVVVTQPDRPRGRGKKMSPSPVKRGAEELGLPVLQPTTGRDPAFIEELESLSPDYLVVVAYGQILPRALLDLPRLAPVNLHASLLPRWRGAAPIHRAFLAGDRTTGVCAMLMSEGLDTGDMILTSETAITDEDTVGSLHDRLAEIGAGLMAQALAQFATRSVEPRQQDESMATYAKKLKNADFVIAWSASAEEVSRHIRALSPFPGAVTTLRGKQIKPLFASVAHPSEMPGAPGQVVAIDKNGVTVACGDGFVLITRLKPEGKKPMTAYAFSLGGKIAVGDFLAS